MGRGERALGIDGETLAITPTEIVGCRDRSWGVRPVGQAPPGPGGFGPQFFWLWAPINFDDVCVHFDTNELGDGRQWHSEGLVMPVLSAPTDPVFGPDVAIETMESVRRRCALETGDPPVGGRRSISCRTAARNGS